MTANERLARKIKLVATTAAAIMLAVYCFDGDDSILGNVLHTVMAEFLGDLRYLIPCFIVIYAVYSYISTPSEVSRIDEDDDNRGWTKY